ncbi:serine/threonine-protein kinase [Massilia cavernae]|uniref:non-specific serine/threonine protein kinase n=1 Tax=Massilia cavernae TaxID=2320864 RepID=A0A418XR88_9BURK|nr:serine/threonine-protein kinase [Massilia cavernae]RJG15020.1 PEGA domain-containing protein [Massilia cavernae]
MTAGVRFAGSENCLPIGTRLADFEITGVLGEGGFGIVYVAFDHSLQRSVAIKEYIPGPLASRAPDDSVTVRAERHQETFELGLKSFINEARFLAQFDHPSLVKVYRFWEQNQTAYTAMQYYEGRTIKDIVANSPGLVTEEWCLKVLRQILGALDMLYTMQLLHRDVSPDNIIVQDNGDAVLLDFGSARQVIGDMTRGLTVILKPGYAPVEQYAGDASLPQGPYTDIYALAAVMYFAIFKEAPPTSIARMIRDPMAPLASRGLEDYSEDFLFALDTALAVPAQERPQTIDSFRALLGIVDAGAPRPRPAGATQRIATVERAQQALKAGTPAPAATATHDGKRAPAPRWMWGMLGGGVLLAGLFMYAVGGGDPVMAVAANQVKPAAAAVEQAELPAPAPMTAQAEQQPPPPDLEAQAWDKIKDASVTSTDAVAAFLSAHPDGRFAAHARKRMAELSKPALPEPRPVEAKPVLSSYNVRIKPWGTVYVDGKERGVSPPMKKLSLTAGRHEVRVSNPGFPDHVSRITVRPGASGTITHDFAAGSKQTH